MDLPRDFTFDDPDDSYWNESEQSRATLFDDTRTAVVARQALDDLFELRSSLSERSTTNSSSEVEAIVQRSTTPIDTIAAPTTPVETPSRERFDDDRGSALVVAATTTTPMTTTTTPPSRSHARRLGSASVVSDACSVSSMASDSTVHLDYARLKSEHAKLQRHLDHVRQERYEPPAVGDAIRRLAACRDVPLDLYKSKQQKLELLDAALDVHNDDVVLMVLLFIQRSLGASLFREILITKSEAAFVYINHLRESGDSHELVDTLFALGRSDEAAIVELELALRVRDAAPRVGALKRCLLSGLSSPTLTRDADHVRAAIDLLERQMLIESADAESTRDHHDNDHNDDNNKRQATSGPRFDRSTALVNASLMSTLHYAALHHYGLPANSYASPLAFKNAFDVNERRYAWTTIAALAQRGAFDDIDQLLTPRSLLGSKTRIVAPVAWSTFFELLAVVGLPPSNLLKKWLNSVPAVDERLRIAEQLGAAASEVHAEATLALQNKSRREMLISKYLH